MNSAYHLHPIPSDLEPYLSAIWTLDSSTVPWEERVWPGLRPDVVFGTTPYESRLNGAKATISSSCVQGVTLTPRTYQHGTDRLTGLQFKAGALSAVVGNLAAARDVLLPLGHDGEFDDLDPKIRVAAAVRWVRRSAKPPVRPALLRGLMQHRSVRDAADAIGVTERTLHRHAVAAFGLSPKEVQRLCRFRGSLTALRDGRTYAEVALHAGYYDQSHFCREFAAFTDMTPSEAFPRPC